MFDNPHVSDLNWNALKAVLEITDLPIHYVAISPMKFAKTALLAASAFLVGGLCTWIVRGEYDKFFMLRGNFHVISTAEKDHKVTLTFPSQQQVTFSLKKEGFFDFRKRDTGEGAITVSIDGKAIEKVGYVTSIGSAVVLVIDDEETAAFSIIDPFTSDNGEATDEP